MLARRHAPVILSAFVVALLLFGWYFQQKMQRPVPFPVPDVEWSDMASWTATWRSGGLQQTVTTAQQEGQTVEAAFSVHVEAVRLAKLEYPPDEE